MFALLDVCAMLGFEHPADPASWAPAGSSLAEGPSIWQFPEMQRSMQAVGAWKARLAIADASRPV